MAIDCFKNLIGISDICNVVASDSGLNIQDLPGMTLDLAEAVKTSDHSSGVDLINRKIELSAISITEELRSKLGSKLRSNSVVENDVIGFYQNDLPTVAFKPDTLRGIQIRVDRHPYLELFISSISLQVNVNIPTVIEVWDLMTGIRIDTIPITTAVNEIITIDVFKNFKTHQQKLNLFIAYDAEIGDGFKSLLRQGFTTDCDTCSHSRRHYQDSFIFTQAAEIADASTKVQQNLKGIGNTGGLSITYSLNCELDSFICSIKNRLAYPQLYRTGILLVEELLFSNSRLNPYVAVHRGKHEELMELYQARYDESMESILTNLALPNDICFECVQTVSTTNRIP